MSEDIKKEIESQITGTRLSIMAEIKRYFIGFYISIIGMVFCLCIGFYIGNSGHDATAKMVYHTQKKVDLIMDKMGIKYDR